MRNLYVRLLIREHARHRAAMYPPASIPPLPHFEALEQRLLLSTDPLHDGGSAGQTGSDPGSIVMSTPLTITTSGPAGDVVTIDIETKAAGLPYTITSAELTTGVPRPLTLFPSGSKMLLKDGAEVIAALVSSLGTPSTPLQGQLYLAPATASSLTHDGNPAAPGFQGQITLTIQTGAAGSTDSNTAVVTVTEGYSTGGAGSVVASGAVAALRAQQRLNFLGFHDMSGQVLALTNVVDLPTQQALRLFRAAVDQTGTLQAADAGATLSATTVGWLNTTDAPRWQSISGVSGAETYGTNWLVQTVQAAVAAVPGATLADVAALSQPDGWSSSATRGPGTPGRHHQVGMEVDIVVPPGAQTASGGGSMTAAEQRLFDLAIQLKTSGQSSHQLRLIQVALSNTKVVAALSASPSMAGVTVNTSTESAGVMHVGFAAPAPPTITATQKTFLLDALDGLVDMGNGLVADSRLQWAIPLLLRDPGGGNPKVEETLADALALGQKIHDGIYQPIHDWLTSTPTPTVSDLVSQVAGLTGFSGVVAGLDNSAERVSFTFHYAKQYTTTLEMDLGTAASDAGITLATPPAIGVAASFGFDVTVGVDLSRGATASQAGFVQVSNFHVGADVSATSLNFAANVGFLGAQVQNGHFLLDVDLAAAVAGGAETSLGALASTPVGSLVTLTPTGSVDLTLPLQASIGGWSTPTGPSQPKIAITDTDLFDGPGSAFSFNPTVDLNLSSVTGFGQVSSASMVGVFGQLGSWLGNFQASSLLSTPIPFTSGKTLGTVLGLNSTLVDNVINHLETAPNQPAFASAQALATLLPGIITGVQFDPAYAPMGGAPVLTYTFSLAKAFTPITATINLDLLGSSPASHLASFTTTSTVTLTPSVTMGFTLRIDMTPQGQGVTMTTATTLEQVTATSLGDATKHWNDLVPDDSLADLNVTLRSGAAFSINLDSLSPTSTIGSVLALLNSAHAGFSATFDADAKRFILTDASTPSGADPQFRVAAANGSLAGLILGLPGSDADTPGTIRGGAVHGDVLDNHVFIDNAAFHTSVALSAPDIDAAVKFGIISLAVTNGSGSVSTGVDVTLNDPVSGLPAPVSLKTLSKELSKLGTPATKLVTLGIASSATLNLPISVTSSLPGLGGLTGASPAIQVSWPHVFNTNPVGLDLGSFSIDFHNFDRLANFGDLGTDDVVGLLGQVAGFVSSLSGADFMGVKMPVIDKTPGELLSFAKDFADTVAKFKANPSLGLDGLQSALASALGSAFTVGLALDASGSAPALRLNLGYTKNLAPGLKLPMNFDLSSLGLDGVSKLIDVSGAGALDVAGGVSMTLALGLDLADLSNPKPFLYDTTGVNATLGVHGSNITFKASLGPLGLYIGRDAGAWGAADPGLVALDADGLGGSASPASFHLGLVHDPADGRYFFTDPVLSSLSATLTGQAAVRLPVFFPNKSTYLDAANHNLEVHVTNLADPISSFSVVTVPDFANLISNLDLSGSLDSLISGFDGLLQLLEQGLSGKVLGVQLPLIGDKLSQAARFVRDLREDVTSALEGAPEKTATMVQQVLFDALGPGGLNWLKDSTSDGAVTMDDVVMAASASQVSFNVKLGSDLVEFSIPFGLDLGIPGLGLDVDGQVTAKVGFDFTFGLGVSRSDGVYFDVSAAHDLNVYFDVDVSSLSATGQLLFLQLDANTLGEGDLTADQISRSGGAINAFKGSFQIDIGDPNHDGKLTLAELATVSDFGSILDARLDANASMHVALVASLGGSTGFPSIGARFHLYWAFGDATNYELAVPEMEFTDVRLNIGEFFTDLFGSTLKAANDALEPIKPILDILTTPIPVISDLAGSPVRLVDLARMFGKGWSTVADIVETADTIADLLSMVGFGDNMWIDLGGFSLAGFNPHTQSINDFSLPTDNLNDIAKAFNADSAIGALGNGALSSFYDAAKSLGNIGMGSGVAGGIKATITFNLNDPDNDGKVRMNELAQNFLLGGIWIFDIGGKISASLEAYIKVDLGIFSWEATFELASITILDFELPRPSPATPDPAVVLATNSGGTLTINIGPNAAARVAGDLSDGSDTVRIDAGYTPDEVVVKAFGIQQRYTGVTKIVADGGAGDDNITVDHNVKQEVELHGGAGNDVLTAGGGKAKLYGDDGNDRLYGGDADDELTGGAGDDTLVGGIGNDLLDGGDGADNLDGGLGDDQLFGGAGNDLLTGGPGNDLMDGGDGDDELHGGKDNDHLIGGAGNDRLYGDENEDTIEGGLGADIIEGNSGNDWADGGPGNDNINGGPGNDTLLGGDDDDQIYGGLGSDYLDGGAGNDMIVAGTSALVGTPTYAGEPESLHTLLGGPGNDTIYGDLGRDTIDAGDGNNIVRSFAADDTITAGTGNDDIDSGTGDDIIHAGDGNNHVVGGLGNEQIYTGSGNDYIDARGPGGPSETTTHLIVDTGGNNTVYGDLGDDTITTGDGIDFIYAYGGHNIIHSAGGNDTIISGSGVDDIWAGDGDDFVNAGDGTNTVYGGAGDDTITTGSGVDVVFGEGGADVITSTGGNDRLYGGPGYDEIHGGAGDDLIVGGGGDDLLYGDAGNDLIWGGTETYEASFFDHSNPALWTTPVGWDDAEADNPTGYVPPHVTPTIVAGLSIDGQFDDGEDTIYGGDGNDVVFSGGMSDLIDGGAGNDYIDGGVGADDLRGGDGDDVIRGGSNDDQLRGGAGIDQLYGDDGSDVLFGDAGNGADQAGQRLWGGAGIDYLYGYAPTTNVPIESLLKGDELHGGSGNDWLYGNIRRDIIYGDSGNDNIYGDWLKGPGYAVNPYADRDGGDDRLFGDSGDDMMYGGGGRDEMWGGANSDWLEGQNGQDTMYGGGWIDVIKLDTSDIYTEFGEIIDGHYGNRSKGDVPDDNATDILLIEGTQNNDTILLSEPIPGVLSVSYKVGGAAARIINIQWRHSVTHAPLVEQFRCSGLMGDDTIGFVTGPDAVNLDVLNARSRDWVGVFDGGPGNDTLIGGGGRDHFDGGRGSDTLYGFGGDDRLWGDIGNGAPGDHDRLFAGQGNDDLLGGVGTNELYAWSFDPNLDITGPFNVFSPGAGDGVTQFGVFVDPATGLLYDNDGGGLYQVEDTGLNRMLGQAQADDLYGGTGLDFLYGNGGDDRLFTHSGELFEAGYGVPAGDEWKAYARSTNKVWYYSGTNADDVITVDYVTEPGLLAQHHLITRLTNNGGNFSFDAQVRLDFGAKDAAGNYIWDPTDTLVNIDRLRNPDPDERGAADTTTDVQLVGNLLPPEGDFLAIIIDALGGNDQITVGPTVQKTVWIDGGPGDDRIEILSGNPILVDQTDDPRNGVDGTPSDFAQAYALPGPAALVLTTPSVVLSESALFTLGVNGGAGVEVTLNAAATAGNTSIDDLVADLANALAGAGLAGLVTAMNLGGHAAIRTTAAGASVSLAVSSTNTAARDALGLADGQKAAPTEIAGSTAFKGLTIDNPRDVDWYSLRLAGGGIAANIALKSASANDKLVARLYKLTADNTLELVASNEGVPLSITPDATENLLIAHRGLTKFDFLANVAFSFVLNGNEASPVSVTLPFGLTSGNTALANLVTDLNAALATAGLANQIVAGQRDSRLTFAAKTGGGVTAIKIAGATDLGFDAEQTLGDKTNAYPLDPIADLGKLTGLTLHGAADADWFRFAMDSAELAAGGTIRLEQITAGGALKIELCDAAGAVLASASVGASETSATLNLSGLHDAPAGDYYIRVTHAPGSTAPAMYRLVAAVPGTGSTVRDLSGEGSASLDFTPEAGATYLLQVTSPNLVPTIYDLTLDTGDGAEPVTVNLGASTDFVRRDVILGGDGNDVLSGGPGEDWIFGGAGNDVLTGGQDYQASDLLFGGEGNDTFQVIPDALSADGKGGPLTLADRFDGGPGDDRVLFLGGDLDRLGRPVPDWVAIRWSRFIYRYEFTSLQWDAANQQFMVDNNTLVRAKIVALDAAPANGRLTGNATFTLRLGSTTYGLITVTAASTSTNVNIQDLIVDINAAIAAAGLGELFLTGNVGTHLYLASVGYGEDLKLVSPGGKTETELHFAAEQTAKGTVSAYVQNYAFYQAVNVEHTVIDTRAGDDEVHGDPEYKFPLADGSGILDDEWGIKAGNYQEGATVGALEIYGGEGNDRLFGGYLADTIDGGAGSDFMAGAEGDDHLTGGAGADLLVGEGGVAPDRYEFTARGNEDGSNTSPLFAALLKGITSGSITSGLSFSIADRGDWYIIPTPAAVKAFGAANDAHLAIEMLLDGLKFDSPYDQAVFDGLLLTGDLMSRWAGENAYLYAAEVDNPNLDLSLVPAEKFAGVPDYYMLHIVNPRSFGVKAVAPPKTEIITGGDTISVPLTLVIDGVRSAQFTLSVISTDSATTLVGKLNAALAATNLNAADASKGKLSTRVIAWFDPREPDRIVISLRSDGWLQVDLADAAQGIYLGFEDKQDNQGPVDSLGTYTITFPATLGQVTDVGPDTANQVVEPIQPADLAMPIALGDLNHDGFADFITTVRNTIGTAVDAALVPDGVHPQEIVGASYATIYLSDPSLDHVTAADGRYITLKLPAPVGADSFGTSSVFARQGDYNGDGFDDIAVGIASINHFLSAYSQEGVYIIFGHGGAWPAQIDLVNDADTIINGFQNLIRIDSAGDFNHDGFDDLLASEIGPTSGGTPYRGRTYLFLGNAGAATGSGVLYRTAFGAGDTGGFTINNSIGAPVAGLWHLSTGRSADALHSSAWSFYFGTGEAGGDGNYDVGDTAGAITSPPIVLAEGVGNLELSFRYYLRTERGGPMSTIWDKATVQTSTDGITWTDVASNNDTLVETVGAEDYWHRAVINLGGYAAGQTVRFRFLFDTGDAYDNHYEGWYVDDVKVRATLSAASIASARLDGHLQYDVTGFRLAGLGDVNGDGLDDFAVANNGNYAYMTNVQVYLIYGRTTPLPTGDIATIADKIVSLPFTLPRAMEILPAGNLDGSAAKDFVVTALAGLTPTSYLVFQNDAGTDFTKVAVDGNLTALGDINGDGFADLARATGERTQTLVEDGTWVEHQVEQVFLGAADKDWAAAGAFDQPSLIFENARPRYAQAGQLTMVPGLFAAVGDVNGDGVGDLAMADGLGGKVRVFFGAPLTTPTPPTVTPLAPERFRFTLATPWMATAYAREGLDLNATDTPDIHDAFRLDGAGRDDHLAGSQSIGDFNRDGYSDLAVWDDGQAHVLLGPVKLNDTDPIETRSEMNIDLAGLGAMATGYGDIDGDGFSDLAFVRYVVNYFNPSLSTYTVSVLWGNPDPNRSLSVADAQTILTVTVGNFNTASTPQLRFINWDADSQADLVLFLDSPGAAGEHLYGVIFAGADVDRDDGPVLTLADAMLKIAQGSDDLFQLGTQMFGPGYSADYALDVVSSGLSAATSLTAADLNGDGKDELLFARPHAVAVYQHVEGGPDVRLPDIGIVYMLQPSSLGPADTKVTIGNHAIGFPTVLPAIQGFALGAGVFNVGDLNRDGLDDVAVTRWQEGVGLTEGSVLVFYGPVAAATPPEQTADVTIRRVGSGVLPADTWTEGPLQVTGGNFDGLGTPDLAISQPWSRLTDGSTVFDEQSRGVVHVIWNVAGLGSNLVLADGPVDLNGDGLRDMVAVYGQSEGDQFGTLPITPNLNLDNDRYDDLVIGAPLADTVSQSVKQDAGKIYAVYGSPRRLVLPGLDTVVELTNRSFTGLGDRLVDPATGRPVTFTDLDTDGDGLIDTTDFTLAAGQADMWYRFTTAGDGKAGNVIRVLQPAYADRQVLLVGPAGSIGAYGIDDVSSVIQVGGDLQTPGVFEFDLSGLIEQLGNPGSIDKAQLALSAIIQPDLAFTNPAGYAQLNGKTYFLGRDATGSGELLYVTDGTIKNTQRVAQVEAQTPYRIVSTGDHLYFIARDDNYGYELWASDGTEAGTQRVTDIYPGSFSSNIAALTAFGNAVYFQASDSTGPALWKVSFAGNVPQTTKLASSFRVGSMAVAGARLFISSIPDSQPTQYHAFGLYSTDGATLKSHGTIGLPLTTTVPLLQYAGAMDGWLYFEGSFSAGTLQPGYTQLMRANGNTVQQVTAANLHNIGGPLKAFAAVYADGTPNNRMFFVANGVELWDTNTTGDAASKVTDLFSVVDPAKSDALALRAGDHILMAAKGAYAGILPQIKILSIDGGGVVTTLRTLDASAATLRRIVPFASSAIVQVDSTAPVQTALWITDGSSRGTRLLYAADDPTKNLLDVGVSGNQILFDDNSPLDPSVTLWVSDGRKVMPITDTGSLTGAVTFEILDEEGDGVVTLRDGALPASLSTSASFTTGPSKQWVHVDLTDLIRAVLERGQRHATLRMTSDPSLLWKIDAPPDEETPTPTGLEVTLPHGVLVDVCDANGGVLYQGLGAVDMRWLNAGTYYLRVYNPHAAEQTTDLRFSVEISPPPQGQTHQATDMDLIEGGDGDDILVGGPHLDRLFGQSGQDAFWAEKVEMRDLEADEAVRAPDAADRLVSDPPHILDPVVNSVFLDGDLILAVGEALGDPVRRRWPRPRRPISWTVAQPADVPYYGDLFDKWRREEALGLQREDVDLAASTSGMIRVQAKTAAASPGSPRPT